MNSNQHSADSRVHSRRRLVVGLSFALLVTTVPLTAGCGGGKVTSTVSTVSTVTTTRKVTEPSSTASTTTAVSDAITGPQTSCTGEGANSPNRVLAYYIRGQITCKQARLAFAGRAAGSNRWYGWDSAFASAGEGICYTILRRHASSPRLEGQGSGPAQVKVATLGGACGSGQN